MITTASIERSEIIDEPRLADAEPERAVAAVPIVEDDRGVPSKVLGQSDVLMLTDSVRREAADKVIEPPSRPRRDLGLAEHASEVQRRLAELGYFSAPASGSWGRVSRGALLAFKVANQLPANDVWDPVTEEALFRRRAVVADAFVGVWAIEAGACSARRVGASLPTIIESNQARAGEASCVFQSKRRVASDWAIVAKCTTAGENWTAHVRLTVTNDRLTWASERGTQQYLRCGPITNVAGLR